MEHKRVRVRGVCRALCVLASVCTPASAQDTRYPGKPIKVVVPFAPGGGSDTFVRLIQSSVRENGLLPQPLQVINVPGAGGTIGSRRVKNAFADGYTILNLHDGLLSARHGGQALYGAEAFLPIVGTGRSASIVCVADNAEYSDLNSLLEAAHEEPGALRFAANLGALSHFTGLALEEAVPGSRFRFVAIGGGAKRFAGLTGGHVEVSVFSVSEYARFQAGGLRALALLSEERLTAFPDVPTAREQGIDVVSDMMQFWWAPRGTPPERVRFLADVLEQAMETEWMRDQLKRLHIEPLVVRGEELTSEIARRDRLLGRVSVRDSLTLPNFPVVIGVAVAVLGLAVVVTPQAARRGAVSEPEVSDLWRPLLIAIVTVLFVATLQMRRLPFSVVAPAFIVTSGLILLPRTRRAVVTLLVTAAAVSLICHFVFGRFLVIDLF